MNFDFDTLVNRSGIGNMKGGFDCPKDTVLLSGAEMDFATAPVIIRALSEFAARGLYGFTLADADYRASICWWMAAMRGFDVQSDWIVPTMGTIFGLSTALRSFTQPGDGVIIQHPSYYRFDRAILRNGRRVVSNPMKNIGGVYEIDFDDLEEKMRDPRNRMLLLCNPHNPTGKVFSQSDLHQIAALAARYDVIVFSDEIFAETAQEGHSCLPYAKVDPERGISSTSLGKAFNFTGVNHANLIIPSENLRARYRAQQDIDHFGSIDPFFYNALRAAYSSEGAAWIGALNAHLKKIDMLMREALSGTLLALSPVEGGFVSWLDCRALSLSDEALDKFILEQAHILADPGWEYGPGGSGFIRLNIATTTTQMQRAMDNLKNALKEGGNRYENHPG